MAFYPYPYTPPEKKPLPTPDGNWVDHVKENRKYLQSIQKVGISKRFKGLKETMMYLMEVSCDSVELNKLKSDNVKVSIKDDFRLYVKFLDYLFWEIDGNDQYERPKDSPSYSDLFQSMFTPAKNSNTLESSSKTNSEKEILDDKEKKPEIVEKIPDTKEDNKKARDKTTSSKKSGHKKSKGKKESKGSKGRGRSKDSDKSKEVKAENDVKETKEKTDHKQIEETKAEQNTNSKGKASLFVMKGEKLIRSLQEHSINVKVVEQGEKTEDTKTEDITSGNHSQKKAEGVVLATTSFRVPESFRMAVLSFSDSNTELPSREKHSDTYKLMDTKKEDIGKVNVTVTLTCFGKVVENCIREVDDGEKYKYEHTRCWRTFSEEKAKIPKINPKLALHLMNTAAKITPTKWKSDEILRNCITLGLIKVDDEERRRLLKRNKCKWNRLAKQSTNKFEINSKGEEDEVISALKTSKKHKSLESSCTVIKSPSKTFGSVVELTTVVSSTVITSGASIAEKTEWATSCLSRNVPRPKANLHTVPIDKIREATENEDLKELWMKQRIINKAFKEEQFEKTRKKPSVYERLEKLRLKAGDIRTSADQRPTKESIKSSIVNVEK